MEVANYGNSCHFFKSKLSYLTYIQPLSLNNQCKIIEYSNICLQRITAIYTYFNFFFFLGYLPNFKPRVAGYLIVRSLWDKPHWSWCLMGLYWKRCTFQKTPKLTRKYINVRTVCLAIRIHVSCIKFQVFKWLYLFNIGPIDTKLEIFSNLHVLFLIM